MTLRTKSILVTEVIKKWTKKSVTSKKYYFVICIKTHDALEPRYNSNNHNIAIAWALLLKSKKRYFEILLCVYYCLASLV